LPAANLEIFMDESVNALERLVAEGAYGEAFYEACLYMTRFNEAEDNDRTRNKTHRIIDLMIKKLISLPAHGRNLHLDTIRGRVHYIINENKNYDQALELLELVNIQLINRLGALLPPTELNSVNRMELENLSAALAIANHRGNTGKAEQIVRQVKKVMPRLAQRWENFQPIMEFLFLESVHLQNCYDFDRAMAEQAGLLATAGCKYNKEYKSALKLALRKYREIYEQPGLPAAMTAYFAQWPKVLQQALQGQMKEDGPSLLHWPT